MLSKVFVQQALGLEPAPGERCENVGKGCP